MTEILAFAGSTRAQSLNKMLAEAGAAAARSAGADVTCIDLRDFPMPIYDGDLEAAEGVPEHAMRLQSMMIAADGLLLACPEYNSSITAVLKNTIDWVSRPAPGHAQLEAFRGKVAALMSASPGGLGGLRGLVHVRAILGNIGVLVLPDQVAVPAAHKVFAEDRSIQDPRTADKIGNLAAELVRVTSRMNG